MTAYKPRIADNQLKKMLRRIGAVLIQGPKWCGKTTTAEQMAYLLGSTYMNPEIPGIKYSEAHGENVPYFNIYFGWDIPNNPRWHATKFQFILKAFFAVIM